MQYTKQTYLNRAGTFIFPQEDERRPSPVQDIEFEFNFLLITGSPPRLYPQSISRITGPHS